MQEADFERNEPGLAGEEELEVLDDVADDALKGQTEVLDDVADGMKVQQPKVAGNGVPEVLETRVVQEANFKRYLI